MKISSLSFSRGVSSMVARCRVVCRHLMCKQPCRGHASGSAHGQLHLAWHGSCTPHAVSGTIPILPPTPPQDAPQRIVKVRRDYNTWVASETHGGLRAALHAARFRKWSTCRVANTAFGAASFLVLEAVGATLLVNYGFINAFWAILATGLIIFLAGLPISFYAARYGVDMDLLTRGAGFGYIGSTITSLIYASLHLHLLRAGGGHHGLCAGAGLRHPAQLGLPGLRAGGDPAGHPRRLRRSAGCRSGRSRSGW